MRIIVNADDCGISLEVNNKIEEYINKGIISSTTIMSNMPYIEDVKRLYNLYKENISFGIHLNLSEGNPMTMSQILLEKGFYIEENGNVIFNIDNKKYNGKYSKEIEDAIFNELSVQIENVLAYSIEVSHVDSHHHVHTRPYMLNIVPRLQDKFHFTKIRRMRNYMPISMKRYARDLWWYFMKIRTKGLKTTDWFCGYEEFIEYAKKGFIKDNSIIELMTHPGGYTKDTEGPLMEETNLKERFNAQIINYNEL